MWNRKNYQPRKGSVAAPLCIFFFFLFNIHFPCLSFLSKWEQLWYFSHLYFNSMGASLRHLPLQPFCFWSQTGRLWARSVSSPVAGRPVSRAGRPELCLSLTWLSHVRLLWGWEWQLWCPCARKKPEKPSTLVSPSPFTLEPLPSFSVSHSLFLLKKSLYF